MPLRNTCRSCARLAIDLSLKHLGHEAGTDDLSGVPNKYSASFPDSDSGFLRIAAAIRVEGGVATAPRPVQKVEVLAETWPWPPFYCS